MWAGLWVFGDDWGTAPRSPRWILGNVYPERLNVDAATVERLTQELIDAGLVIPVDAAGRHYLIRSLDRKGTTAVPVSRIPSATALHQVVEHRIEMARRRPGAPAGADRR